MTYPEQSTSQKQEKKEKWWLAKRKEEPNGNWHRVSAEKTKNILELGGDDDGYTDVSVLN